jgi:hypothetical protein
VAVHRLSRSSTDARHQRIDGRPCCHSGLRLVPFGLLPTCERIWKETLERSRTCATWQRFVVS